MNSGDAIFAGAILATIGWMYTGRLQRRMDRRQHTYRMLIRQQDDAHFHHCLQKLRDLLKKGDITAALKNLSDEDIEGIDYILNHYEVLAAAIWTGDVDEKLVRDCEYSRMARLIDKFRTYITTNRTDHQQPSMFENLETLVTRWKDDDRPASQRFHETLTMRSRRHPPAWGHLIDRADQYRQRLSRWRHKC